MLFDVECRRGAQGWRTDLTTGSRRYAVERARRLIVQGFGVRVVNMYGETVDYRSGSL